jgi:hypothetical protein
MDDAIGQMQDLFGPTLMAEAEAIHPDSVDAQAVSDAASDLLMLMGEQDQQKELIQDMDRPTAAALCRWIYDPTFWRAVGRIKAH